MTRGVGALASAVLLTACWGSHEMTFVLDAAAPSPPDADVLDAGVDLDAVRAFIEARRRARCLHEASCEGLHSTFPPYIARACHPAANESSRRWLGTPRLDGTCEPPAFSFDPVAAERCLRGIATADCRLDYGDDEGRLACHDAIVPAGLGCVDGRCPPGEMCSCLGPRCDAECVPRVPEGGACAREHIGPWPSECALDLRCHEGTCKSLPEAGEPCIYWECAPGNWCDLRADTCVPGGLSGGPCRFDCEGDFHCVPDGAGGMHCVPGAPIGEHCSERIGCTESEDCDPPPCERGGRCVAGRCQAIRMPGESCGADGVCAISFHCEAGRCVPDPALGEVCDERRPCVMGRCVDGVCEGLPPGATCVFAVSGAPLGECASGGWADCRYESERCADPGALGERCGADLVAACLPGLECDHRTDLCVDRCWCDGEWCPP